MIEVIGSNDHSPIFSMPETYTVDVQEYDAITMTSPWTAGDTIFTVTATDEDDSTSLAGMIAYIIEDGAVYMGETIFSIPNPAVNIFSSLFKFVHFLFLCLLGW